MQLGAEAFYYVMVNAPISDLEQTAKSGGRTRNKHLNKNVQQNYGKNVKSHSV